VAAGDGAGRVGGAVKRTLRATSSAVKVKGRGRMAWGI
jgi:hypothetical protein